MNEIEEKLWNYIDGTCTAAEQEAIAGLIANNELYAKKYQELLALNQEFAAMELDEPPMAFTYNVMEAIRTENALQPLKAAIDKRIIKSIAIFFMVTITALLVMALSSIDISGIKLNMTMPALKLPNAGNILSSPFMKWFLIFDVVLALFLTDTYLRRRKATKHV
ncbi:MAG: hypothetical protein AAGC65_23880 [Mucilaginibacter sp.]|uniref:hypothetical protein n=1 Tax=Mucilaginibacter sp. TaxID=1882438 RepID=UPI0031AF4BE6